jgi:hypothetical protein
MSSATRRVVVAIAIVLLAVAALATMQGWVGDGATALLRDFWPLLAGFVAVYYDLFERVGKILAPFVAVASGGYAIYQKWHYAGRNLHLRLQEFLQQEEKRLRAADDELDKNAERPGPARPFQSPIFPDGTLGPVLRKMAWGTPTLTTLHWSRIRRAEREVQRASKELEEQLALWESRKKDYQRRLVQAHLVKGAMAAARAAKIKARGRDDREHNQAALTEFERAMNVDPTQTEPLALEFAAHQRVRLGDYSGAVQDFGKLAQWAETASNPMLRSRALKFQAEIHECRNESQPNVHVATRLLNTAIQIFPTPLTQTEIIEAAELREAQGRIRSKESNFDWDDAALNSYTDAEGLYHQINGPIAEAALKRIAVERARILARRHSPLGDSNGSTPGGAQSA